MTNNDKSLLVYLVKNEPENSDQDMAEECNCSVGTVRAYRKSMERNRQGGTK